MGFSLIPRNRPPKASGGAAERAAAAAAKCRGEGVGNGAFGQKSEENGLELGGPVKISETGGQMLETFGK